MSSLDLMQWLDQDEAELVLLTTFGFDPVFFERRVLRSKAISRARRILVLMDANEWGKVVRSQEPIRSLNQRYLVVPVARGSGVFHPKVGLLLSDKQSRVYCGSTNLTRAGFTLNIELVNSLSATVNESSPPAAQPLILQAFQFFERVVKDADGNGSDLARHWLHEARFNWGFNATPTAAAAGVELIHTMDRNLWEQVQAKVSSEVGELLIVSPFWDKDLHVLKEFRRAWPLARVRIVAQTRTSNLDPFELRNLDPKLVVESPAGGGRVLHAKLVAWRSGTKWSCLVGSANFTDAAWSGRNVEACIFVSDATAAVEHLFGDEVTLELVALDAFEKGSLQPPEQSLAVRSPLTLRTAQLSPSGMLTVSYGVDSSADFDQLALGIRGPGDADPAFTAAIPRRDQGDAILQLPESIVNLVGSTLRASLIAHRDGFRTESPALWVVQERRLTVERGESDERAQWRRVAETGEGLPEFADEVFQRQGVHGLVELLRNTTIRYVDSSEHGAGIRGFAVRVHDPYRDSQIPGWLAQLSPADDSQLKAALIEFADRHERQRLRRHAKAGNINGLENYLDILRAITRMLFIWYRRGRFPATRLVGQLCRLIEISTTGVDERDDKCPGYLVTLSKNLRADRALFQRRVTELGLLETVQGVLWLARVARAQDAAKGTSRASLLQMWEQRLRTAIHETRLHPLDPQATVSFLSRLNVAEEDELRTWSQEILARTG
jgi:hypothetical protein